MPVAGGSAGIRAAVCAGRGGTANITDNKKNVVQILLANCTHIRSENGYTTREDGAGAFKTTPRRERICCGIPSRQQTGGINALGGRGWEGMPKCRGPKLDASLLPVLGVVNKIEESYNRGAILFTSSAEGGPNTEGHNRGLGLDPDTLVAALSRRDPLSVRGATN